jgi:hypothetical protein
MCPECDRESGLNGWFAGTSSKDNERAGAVNAASMQSSASIDLLDADESTLVFVGRVGWTEPLLVKSLARLASVDGCRSYCGRTADEHGGLPARRYWHGSSGSITRKPIPSPSCHRLGPGDMPLEAQRFRHVTVAVPHMRVRSGIAVSPCL